jgi:hypothetical protein
MDRNLLYKRRERVDQSERLTTIAICQTATQGLVGVLLIESKPYPRDQPSKLNEHKWTLKSD